MNFYVIATPIGNLEDISLRALKILKEVDLILCENTLVTKKLLNHYNIKTPTESYHQHSKISKIKKILRLIEEGKNLALVSDAGTPTISDPGFFLISKIYENFPKIKITPIPGPFAGSTLLSVSGLSVSEFTFLGFLPHKKGREKIFKEIVDSRRTVVFYESPYRLLKTLKSLKEKIEPLRKIVIGREMTKIYEEIIRGNIFEIENYFLKNPEKIKGEFVIAIEGK